jgi:hypothetical protein
LRCVRIERATKGEVRRCDLRPDDYLEMWPELANSPAITLGPVPEPQPSANTVQAAQLGAGQGAQQTAATRGNKFDGWLAANIAAESDGAAGQGAQQAGV